MSGKFYESSGIIYAEQKNEVFKIMTPEGEITGRRGDYACITVEGRMFPMRRELFEALFIRMV